MKKEEKLMGKTGVMTKENPASWKARSRADLLQILPGIDSTKNRPPATSVVLFVF
jgi:outer membrane cobalamin receptor